jgi:hypothetical protein
MEVSDQTQALAALLTAKEPSAPSERGCVDARPCPDAAAKTEIITFGN